MLSIVDHNCGVMLRYLVRNRGGKMEGMKEEKGRKARREGVSCLFSLYVLKWSGHMQNQNWIDKPGVAQPQRTWHHACCSSLCTDVLIAGALKASFSGSPC